MAYSSRFCLGCACSSAVLTSCVISACNHRARATQASIVTSSRFKRLEGECQATHKLADQAAGFRMQGKMRERKGREKKGKNGKTEGGKGTYLDSFLRRCIGALDPAASFAVSGLAVVAGAATVAAGPAEAPLGIAMGMVMVVAGAAVELAAAAAVASAATPVTVVQHQCRQGGGTVDVYKVVGATLQRWYPATNNLSQVDSRTIVSCSHGLDALSALTLKQGVVDQLPSHPERACQPPCLLRLTPPCCMRCRLQRVTGSGGLPKD